MDVCYLASGMQVHYFCDNKLIISQKDPITNFRARVGVCDRAGVIAPGYYITDLIECHHGPLGNSVELFGL